MAHRYLLLVAVALVGCSGASDSRPSSPESSASGAGTGPGRSGDAASIAEAAPGAASSEPTSTAQPMAADGSGISYVGNELGWSVTPANSGLDVLVQSRFGYSTAQFEARREQLMYEKVVECLTSRGFDVTPDVLPPPDAVRIGPAPAEGWRLALALGGFASSPPNLSARMAEFDGSEQECRLQAQDEVANPLDAAYAVIDENLDDLQARVQADPRSAKIVDQFERCMNEGGFDASLEAEAQELITQFNEAVDRYVVGELSRDDVITEGQRLREEEIKLMAGPDTCRDERLRAEAEVFRDVEAQFIEENQAVIVAALDSIQDVGQYMGR